MSGVLLWQQSSQKCCLLPNSSLNVSRRKIKTKWDTKQNGLFIEFWWLLKHKPPYHDVTSSFHWKWCHTSVWCQPACPHPQVFLGVPSHNSTSVVKLDYMTGSPDMQFSPKNSCGESWFSSGVSCVFMCPLPLLSSFSQFQISPDYFKPQ